MVNGLGPVWVEHADVRFVSAADLRDAIERILAPLGRRVDEAEPLCDARLPEGTRVPRPDPSVGHRLLLSLWSVRASEKRSAFGAQS